MKPGLLYVVATAAIVAISAGLSAQQLPYVAIGNSDGSPFDVPSQGDVAIPLWIDLPPWVHSGLISLFEHHLIITQWVDAVIWYPWEHGTRIDGNLISIWFWPEPFHPDSLFHLADFTFEIDADSSYWGQLISAISSGPIMFVDSLGWLIDDIAPLISPLCIECQTSAYDAVQRPEQVSHAAYPNPFNSSVTISLTLPREGDVRLTVYDIAGREVRGLFAGKASGNMRFIWDGTDEGGSQVSSGIYFYRIEYANGVYTSKITFLR